MALGGALRGTVPGLAAGPAVRAPLPPPPPTWPAGGHRGAAVGATAGSLAAGGCRAAASSASRCSVAVAAAAVGVLGSLGTAGLLRRRASRLRWLRPSSASSCVRSMRTARQVSTASIDGSWSSMERIYCINLDKRPERWAFMQGQFSRHRMPVQRWSAVDGSTLDVPKLAQVGLVAKEALPRYFLPREQKLFGTDLTDGGIGCALSHFLIWRDILQLCASGAANSKSVFLVIEDDCKIPDQFSEALVHERLSEVPDDWELVYLGGQDLLHRGHEYQVSSGVRRLYKGFRETTAYVINEAGAKACLEVCVPMYWQVDTHMNDESLREGLRPPRSHEKDYTMRPRGYCLWPPIVVQDHDMFKTDVQTVEHN